MYFCKNVRLFTWYFIIYHVLALGEKHAPSPTTTISHFFSIQIQTSCNIINNFFLTLFYKVMAFFQENWLDLFEKNFLKHRARGPTLLVKWKFFAAHFFSLKLMHGIFFLFKLDPKGKSQISAKIRIIRRIISWLRIRKGRLTSTVPFYGDEKWLYICQKVRIRLFLGRPARFLSTQVG